MDTVEIDGQWFLRCESGNCSWNVGRNPGEGDEVTVCSFGSKPWVSGGKPDYDCSHKTEVVNLLAEEAKSQHRFKDPEGTRVFYDMFYPPDEPEASAGNS